MDIDPGVPFKMSNTAAGYNSQNGEGKPPCSNGECGASACVLSLCERIECMCGSTRF